MFNLYLLLSVTFFSICLVKGHLLNDTENIATWETCTLEDGSPGACVALSACAPISRLLKDGRNLLQGLRLVQKYNCGYTENDSKVCCPTAPRAMALKVSRDHRQKSDENIFVDSFPEPPECGFKNEFNCLGTSCCYRAPTLMSGMYALPWMSRYMAQLGYGSRVPGSPIAWQCAGTIITARHVLTAAHCIKRNLLLVKVGETRMNGVSEDNPSHYLIMKTIRHEHYYKFHNDIGVLVTEKQIEFNDYVRPICLPIAQTTYNKTRADFQFIIEGWGITETGKRPNDLLYSTVNSVDLETCRGLYKNLNVTIDDRVLCAGANYTDTCEGDSGGPLIESYCIKGLQGDGEEGEYDVWGLSIPDERREWHYQRGIVSYGFKCAHSRFAGVYTRVEHFMPWLEQNVLGRPTHLVSKPGQP